MQEVTHPPSWYGPRLAAPHQANLVTLNVDLYAFIVA